MASARYLDDLPTQGGEHGQAFRDVEAEQEVLEITRNLGIGAQFGGKYFCHDVRVIRLPRHGASCPVGIGVSCSADRQIKGKITADGVFLEQMETDPAKYMPDVREDKFDGDVVNIDLTKPMDEIRAELTRHPIKTRISLTGRMIVARDIAHAKLKERLDAGEGLPDYMKDHPVYYAGPAKTPKGMASGSFGPTTAGRMDSYVDMLQAAGGSMVMLAKGNRSKQVTEACNKHGGFYLGSIGGAAARLAENSIKKVEVLEYPELGMEAIWRIEVEDFPAFIIVDDKGNDFFANIWVVPLPDLLFDGPKSSSLTVALAHGAGAAMDSEFMNYFAEGLGAHGYRVVRFEFPYMAERRLTGKKRPPDRQPLLLGTWQAVIDECGAERLVIGGKSMGGRMASMIADQNDARGVLALGYPFYGAGRADKPRIDHLKVLQTPTLVCQGTRDPMGSKEIVTPLTVSSSIAYHWAEDGDHSLKPRKKSGRTEEQNWSEALDAIITFLSKLS